MNARMQMQQMTDNIDAPPPVKDEAANDARFFDAMSISNSLDKSAMSIIRSEMMCQPKAVPLEGIELCIGPDCAKYLVLAIKDRIRHGRHFTLKNEFFALTFVSELVTGDGVVVSKKSPYALYGYWIQVRIFIIIVGRSYTKLLFSTILIVWNVFLAGIDRGRTDS